MKTIARGKLYTLTRCDGKLSSVTLFIRAIVVCLRSIADYVVYEILMTVRKLCVVDERKQWEWRKDTAERMRKMIKMTKRQIGTDISSSRTEFTEFVLKSIK